MEKFYLSKTLLKLAGDGDAFPTSPFPGSATASLPSSKFLATPLIGRAQQDWRKMLLPAREERHETNFARRSTTFFAFFTRTYGPNETLLRY